PSTPLHSTPPSLTSLVCLSVLSSFHFLYELAIHLFSLNCMLNVQPFSLSIFQSLSLSLPPSLLSLPPSLLSLSLSFSLSLSSLSLSFSSLSLLLLSPPALSSLLTASPHCFSSLLTASPHCLSSSSLLLLSPLSSSLLSPH